MKIAVSSLSFRDPLKRGELKLFQVPGACAVLGFEFVELADRFLRTRGRTGRLLMALGREEEERPPDLSPVSLGQLEKGLRAAGTPLICFTADNDFIPPKAAMLPEQVRYVKAVIGASRYLECGMVRLWLTQRLWQRAEVPQPTLDAFREVVETAARANVRLALENRSGQLEELEAIVSIIEQIRSYHLGACLSFGRLPPHAWRVGLMRLLPYTIHVHATSRAFDADGNETTIPYAAGIAALNKINYQGFISIEYEGEGDPLEGIVATRRLIERYT